MKKYKVRFLKGEKMMYVVLLLLLLAIPTINIFSKSLLSETNIKNEKLKSKIEKKEDNNASLEMQIDELVSMENIQKIAERYGLSYNSDTILNVTK